MADHAASRVLVAWKAECPSQHFADGPSFCYSLRPRKREAKKDAVEMQIDHAEKRALAIERITVQRPKR